MPTRIRQQRKAFRVACVQNYKNRIEVFGDQAKVCFGCQEILECSGPVSFELCQVLKQMVEDGSIKTVGSIPRWQRWDLYEGKKEAT